MPPSRCRPEHRRGGGREQVIDAEFRIVEGPGFNVGDEHPTQKGWFYTGRFDDAGYPLWFKPPHPLQVWSRRLAYAIIGLLAAAMFFGAIGPWLGELTDPLWRHVPGAALPENDR